VGTTLLIHIAAGLLGIISGYVAVFAAKGGTLHRRGGTVFVYSMLVMGLSGAWIAFVRQIETSVIGGLLTAYLVATGLAAVRPATAAVRRVELGAMLVAAAVGLTSAVFAAQALGAPSGTRNGVPARMFIIFAAIALLSAAGDVRRMRSGGARGTARIARHLWRMCFALWVAAASLFLGQADELPESIRIFPLLAIPSFLPLLLMAWWLWRIRVRKALGEMAAAGARRWTGPAALETIAAEAPK
jgi:uncharacterized membrane protein